MEQLILIIGYTCERGKDHNVMKISSNMCRVRPMHGPSQVLGRYTEKSIVILQTKSENTSINRYVFT